MMNEKNYITLTKEQLTWITPKDKVQIALMIAEYYNYPRWMKETIKVMEKCWDDLFWSDLKTIIEEMLTANYPFRASTFAYAIQIN